MILRKFLSKSSPAKSKRSAQVRPGVISTIMSTLADAKAQRLALTQSEIVSVLKYEFPQRDEVKMAATVRSQLSRLPSEKGFKLKSIRDNGVTRYQAA